MCICRRISSNQLARHARGGVGFDDIQFKPGVATQCGECEICVRNVRAQCSVSCPVANMQPADNLPGGSMAIIDFIDFSFYLALPVSLLLVLGSAWWVVRE